MVSAWHDSGATRFRWLAPAFDSTNQGVEHTAVCLDCCQRDVAWGYPIGGGFYHSCDRSQILTASWDGLSHRKEGREGIILIWMKAAASLRSQFASSKHPLPGTKQSVCNALVILVVFFLLLLFFIVIVLLGLVPVCFYFRPRRHFYSYCVSPAYC